MLNYYDRQGNPISMEDWSELLNDDKYQRVVKDTIGDVEVSTVWLGLNHAYDGNSIHIFETMIFGHDTEFCHRYATEEEAIRGHLKCVVALSEGREFGFMDELDDINVEELLRRSEYSQKITSDEGDGLIEI